MMQHLLKEKLVLIGADFPNIESDVRKLNMYFEATLKSSKEEFEELKQALGQACTTFNGSKMYVDEAKELFEQMKQAVIHEKPQSKFISKPRHNFRKR